ncbi:MAG: hypothetical protein JWO09_1819 [Bacteroidetes bacterium]|nr:hypothetical protein [Bacteroidota bacterium]
MKRKLQTLLLASFLGTGLAAQPLYWAASMGSGSDESGNAIVTDPLGNVYTTGYFMGTVDFDPGAGVTSLVSTGSYDVFITKTGPSGNLIWAKKMGGVSYDYGMGIALDSACNVYTAGYYQYTMDMNPGTATANVNSAGSLDAFISKLDSAGNYIWGKSFGGLGPDQINSIFVDKKGIIYTTGTFQSTADFDPSAATVNMTSAGGNDIFVSKFTSAGTLVWAKQMGSPAGSYGDAGYDIAADTAGNVYTIGSFKATADFDPGAGTYTYSCVGGFNDDIFISKLDSAGNFVWAEAFGDYNYDDGYSIALDDSSNVYATGKFYAVVDFDASADSMKLDGGSGGDAFVLKLNNAGNFKWVRQLGDLYGDEGFGIALDSSANVYTTGSYEGTVDFDPGAGVFTLATAASYRNVFVSKLDAMGNFIGAAGLGGTSTQDRANAIAVDNTNKILITGYMDGTGDYDPGAGVYDLVSTGGTDIFIAKLDVLLTAPTGISAYSNGNQDATVYPNPFTDKLTVMVNTTEQEATDIFIYNLLGELVYTESNVAGKTIGLDRNAMNKGIYIYSLVQGNQIISKGKLIAQ